MERFSFPSKPHRAALHREHSWSSASKGCVQQTGTVMETILLLPRLIQKPLQRPAEQSRGRGVGEGAGGFEDGEARVGEMLEPEVGGGDGRGLGLPAPG